MLISPLASPLHPVLRGILEARRATGGAWSPLSLFSAGEQGVWYDPSDMSTMWQDSAGTIPVTAAGQPVGKMLDKSGRGNHATQPTAGKRPMLGREPFGGRRNLLLNSDALSTQSITVTATPYTLKFSGAGTVALSGAATMAASGAGTYTFTPTAGTLTLTVVGSVTFAQAELGSTATPYQKVVSSFDVTEAGVPDCWYIKGDGVDDFMSTGNIDFTGTDKMTVWAGFRKLSEAATSTVAGFGGLPNLGSWEIIAPTGADANNVGCYANGSFTPALFNSVAAPFSAAIVQSVNISGSPQMTARMNGVQSAANNTLGTGNFGNYFVSVMARTNGSGLFFNGPISSLIVRGAATDAAGITNGEKWTAERIGVTLPNFVARYAYSTPAVGSQPAAGQMNHADNIPNKWNISRTDLDGKVITGDLLKNGDTMVLNGVTYTLTGEQFFDTYISLSIDPSTQQPDGNYSIAVYTS